MSVQRTYYYTLESFETISYRTKKKKTKCNRDIFFGFFLF